MIKKICKILFICLFALVLGFLIMRIVMLEAEDGPKTITATENACTAYSAGGEIKTFTAASEIADKGAFRGYRAIWLPESGELQITVKYNILKNQNISTDSQFCFKLYPYDAEDTTAETTEEEAAEMAAEVMENSIDGYVTETAMKGLYGFAHVVFKDVDLTDGRSYDIVMLTEDGVLSIDAEALFSSKVTLKNLKLSKNDKSVLDSAIKSSSFVTVGE